MWQSIRQKNFLMYLYQSLLKKFSVLIVPGILMVVERKNVPISKKAKHLDEFSKNEAVIRAFEEATGYPVLVDPNSHLIGAIGAATLAKRSRLEKHFTFDIADIEFTTKGLECGKCANNCEIICVYRDNMLIDSWGNKCEKGEATA